MIINRITGTDETVQEYVRLTNGAAHISISSLRPRLKKFFTKVEKKSHGWEETSLRLFKFVFESIDIIKAIVTYRQSFNRLSPATRKVLQRFEKLERSLDEYRKHHDCLDVLLADIEHEELVSAVALLENTITQCFDIAHSKTFPVHDDLLGE